MSVPEHCHEGCDWKCRGTVQGYFLFTLCAHAATSTASRPPMRCFTWVTASPSRALIAVMPMAS